MKKLAMFLSAVLLSGCVAFTNVEIPINPPQKEYAEKVISADPGAEVKVALIELEGVLSDDHKESLFSTKESSVVSFVEKLKRAEADPAVKAVVIRMNTPGGEVTASDVLYHELKEFKERKKVPVVAAFMGISASGGYYVAGACDRIVAHPTTITGSIGVVALHVSLAGLLGKIGVKVEAIKSGPMKDVASPFREMTEEDRKLLQGLIDQMYDRFVGVVAEGRKGKLTEEQVRKLADGRVYTASQALEAKLVDRIGYLAEAVEEAKSLAGVKAAALVMYSRRPQQMENVYSPALSAEDFGTSDLEQARKLLGMHLYYIWEPYVLGK